MAQFGRALRSGRRGRVFESRRLDYFLPTSEKLVSTSFFLYISKVAEIAQSVEHFTRNEGVVGSSPIFSLRE